MLPDAEPRSLYLSLSIICWRKGRIVLGKLILYGAGDFINDYEGISGHDQYRDDLTLMYFPTLDPATGKLISVKLVPMQIRNFRLNHPDRADVDWLAGILDAESSRFGTKVILQEDGSFLLDW